MNEELLGQTFAGKVVQLRLDQGWGWIESGSGRFFFHANDSHNLQFSSLRSGDLVEFTLGETARGPRALDLRVINGRT